ncbi:hypothetical protein WUBG_14283 [Wuchereria bancrofti]|uniref:Uncharacterized protein n=1 Tax=Wuchereria bancrofti TaxID=6293 RepID=J9EHC8_WUCBA|nr:hypothetical protein WUBG_14283 [Wuchereria bancrofti]
MFRTDEEKESYKLLGDHGYDNRIISMRAIFIAVGPDIAQNREISAFQNIELYNLFANLLRIDAAPNNGTDGILFPVLRNPPALPITAVDQPSDQCTEKINMKVCNFSRNCPLMDNTYQNCSVIFHSSVSASYHFTGELCNLQFCDAIIHFDKKLKKTIMVEGIMRNTIWTEEIKENCVTYIDNVTQTNSCETAKDESYSLISLFGKLDSYYTFDLARLVVPKVFVDGKLSKLDINYICLVMSLMERYITIPIVKSIPIKERKAFPMFRTDEEKESYKLLGDHGYDNRIISMRAIFIAVGPDIAQNREISAFQNIELYNLFASEFPF